MAERRPGNRATVSGTPTGRPGNRLPVEAATPQALASQASVAAVAVQAASTDSTMLTNSDLGVDAQAYSAKLQALSQGALIAEARVVTASSSYGVGDYTIIADATAANIVLALPAAAANVGRQLVAKKVDVSAHTVTIDPNGAETIDGAATKVLAALNATATFVSDGAGWQVI
jgi:hypothetical protein